MYAADQETPCHATSDILVVLVSAAGVSIICVFAWL